MVRGGRELWEGFEQGNNVIRLLCVRDIVLVDLWRMKKKIREN